MIRNYNGNVNRAIVRELKKMCRVNVENLKNLLEEYVQNGEVSFFINLCPFTGCPDEMSELITLKSEIEIREYLKKDFQQRLEVYLSSKKHAEDYLLNSLLEFIKENSGNFPSKDEMKQLEQAAETKRIAELSSREETITTLNTEELILNEILELAEEIMEARREVKPEDISVHDEPYQDYLRLENNNFYVVIQWNRYYRNSNSSDYTCTVIMKDDDIIDTISFYYQYDGTVSIQAEDWCERTVDTETIKDRFVIIHKGIVEIAKEEELEFITEIDYQNVSI